MAKFTNLELVAFAKMMEKHKVPYWYGTCVYKCTDDLLKRKSQQYPSHYGSSRMTKYKDAVKSKTVCSDCVGLLKGYFWSNGGAGVEDYILGKGDFKTKYGANGCPDKSANGFYDYCRTHAPKKYGTKISDMPDVPGIAVFMDGHVGLYIGNGLVIEERGFAYGTVCTKLNSRGWKRWAFIPEHMLEYVGITDSTVSECELGDRLLQKGDTGEDVEDLQEMLVELGYELGEIDGDFGSKTEAAVKKFQRDHKLDDDGEYGPLTHAALVKASESKPAKQTVVIRGGNWNVRTGPGTSHKATGTVVRTGSEYPYVSTADNGWFCIEIKGGTGWVTNKGAKLKE